MDRDWSVVAIAVTTFRTFLICDVVSAYKLSIDLSRSDIIEFVSTYFDIVELRWTVNSSVGKARSISI
jgi:hypothetical protein